MAYPKLCMENETAPKFYGGLVLCRTAVGDTRQADH